MLLFPVSSSSQHPKRISCQKMNKKFYFLKKCLPFLEDVFSKFQKKHSMNSEKTLWFTFQSESSDVDKKMASCGLYFTKSQSEMGEDFVLGG